MSSLASQPLDPSQPLWEIYHGRRVVGNKVLNSWRPATDTDFLLLIFEAAQEAAKSFRKDRHEMANQVMEILDKYTAGSNASAKRQWCDIWDHHGLAGRIDPGYCSSLGDVIVGFP